MKADAEAEQKAQEAAVQTFLHPWAKDSKDKKETKSAAPKVEKVMRAVKSVDDTKVETTEKKEDKTPDGGELDAHAREFVFNSVLTCHGRDEPWAGASVEL